MAKESARNLGASFLLILAMAVAARARRLGSSSAVATAAGDPQSSAPVRNQDVPTLIPTFRGLNCNKYQLFTCLASKGGGQIHSDCCDAIRSVLSPRCLCSAEQLGKTVIKSLLPIAMTCEVLLDIGEPCDLKAPAVP